MPVKSEYLQELVANASHTRNQKERITKTIFSMKNQGNFSKLSEYEHKFHKTNTLNHSAIKDLKGAEST